MNHHQYLNNTSSLTFEDLEDQLNEDEQLSDAELQAVTGGKRLYCLGGICIIEGDIHAQVAMEQEYTLSLKGLQALHIM